MKNTDLKKILEQLTKIDPSLSQTDTQTAIKVLSKHVPLWPDTSHARKKNSELLEKALKGKRPHLVSFYRFAISFSAAAAVLLVIVTGGWYWLSHPVAQKSLWNISGDIPAAESPITQAAKPEQPLQDATLGFDSADGFAADESTAPAAEAEGLINTNKFDYADDQVVETLDEDTLYLPSASEDKKYKPELDKEEVPYSSKMMLEEDVSADMSIELFSASKSEMYDFAFYPGFLTKLESGANPQTGAETARDALELVLSDLLPFNSIGVMPGFSSDSVFVVFRGSQSEEDGLGVANLEKTSTSAQFVPLLAPEDWNVNGNLCRFVGKDVASWDIVEIKKATQKDIQGIRGNMVASNSYTQKMQLAASGPLWIEMKLDSSEAALTEWALMIAGYLPRKADVYQKILGKINEDPRILSKIQNIVLMSSYLFK